MFISFQPKKPVINDNREIKVDTSTNQCIYNFMEQNYIKHKTISLLMTKYINVSKIKTPKL